VGADLPATSGVVEITRILPASPDEVFRAWTDTERMRSWMSPIGEAEADVDLRVGGRFRLIMVGGGRRIEHSGEYLEVDPPSRLSFTWRSPFTGDADTVVTVLLSDHPDGTELHLRHERLTEEAAASHGQGWSQMLDRLETRLNAKEGT
jgi:uncharacterized protein YndB with AHSA1/START domain